MKKLTIIIIGNSTRIIPNSKTDIIFLKNQALGDIVRKVKTKYLTFSLEGDMVSDRYIDSIFEKLDNNYDSIYIQHRIAYDYVNTPKTLTNDFYLEDNKPYYGSYIWSYVFKKTSLLKVIDEKNADKFNTLVDKYFKKTGAIGEINYFHFPKERLIKKFCYTDVKETNYYKNIIYVKDYCNGTFNGYISWLINMGKAFKKKYDLTILYTELPTQTLNRFSKYFRCVKYDSSIDYICDRLVVTYSTYFYPVNIFHLEHNYLFIHGVMSDYKDDYVYKDDIFDYYIAVSKTASEGSKKYYPKDIKTLLNPFVLDEEISTPLRLVSAQRSSKIKRMDRIESLAKALDLEGIPYTWNVFSDYKENTNINGLVFRERVLDPLPYIKDADYFVLLSDSEALPYSIIEALSLNTKVIVTPLDVYNEIGVKDDYNGFIINKEDFNDMDKLRLKVREIYKEKDKKFKYNYSPSYYEGYKDIFK